MFSIIFKKNRLEMKMSQKEIANELGVSFGLISQWEHGKCSPNPEMLQKIADFFFISINDLIGSGAIDAEVLPQFKDLPLDRYKKLSPDEKKLVAQQVNFIIDLLQRKPQL